MSRKSCAFTGHRPNKLPWGYDETAEECIRFKKAFTEQIERLVEIGYTDFLSGMAEGTDTWGALIILALRAKNPVLQLHCILPCKGQDDKWNNSARELYNHVLKQADSIVYVSENYYPGCMLKRNRYLVEHANQIMAVFNGNQRSGTAATIRYAQKRGRGILILDPYTLQVVLKKDYDNVM